ncbi:MAG: LysR family transcriptional regulator [Sphingobium sp.]
MSKFEHWVNFRHFRLVVAIDEHGSILRAANALGLAQPTATKLLQDLEEALHSRLFTRSSRGVEATALGTELIRHGRVLLAQLGHTSQTLEAMSKGLAGHVVLGTLLTASSYLLPTAIARLHSRRPDITLKVIEGTNDQLMPRLMSGELDLVVGRLSQSRYRNDVEQEPLCIDCACIVARRGHPLTSDKPRPLSMLQHCDWILPPTETTLRRQFVAVFNDEGLVAPKATIESVSFLTNRVLILSTDMLGVWPRALVESSREKEDLTILHTSSPRQVGAIGISRRRDTLFSPAAEALIAELRLTAADQNEG